MPLPRLLWTDGVSNTLPTFMKPPSSIRALNARPISHYASHRRLPRCRSLPTAYHRTQHRWQSTLTSHTALSPTTPSIPTSNAALHAALATLNARAPEAVNQSRLQLVQRSLESVRPTLRIGVLGVGPGGFDAAKRVVRLLLADPLGERGKWEDEVLSLRGAGLVRFAEEEGVEEGNALVEVVGSKSRTLQREGVEVLVAPVVDILGDGALVPVLQSPLAGSGRAGFVRFPVHRALVVGQGVMGAVELLRVEGEVEGRDQELVDVVVDMPGQDGELDGVDTTNVDAADRAFDGFRADVGKGPVFSEVWQSSGLSRLGETLFSDKSIEGSIQRHEARLRPALKAQITSLLSSSQTAVDEAESQAQTAVLAQTVPDDRRDKLQSAISEWSEYAHTDLQNSLTYAFESPTWRRTAFPRVLWRIDDVTSAGTEVLYSNFLVETEIYLAFLTGRIGEAGFFATKKTEVTAPAANTLSARLRAETGIDTSTRKPWPRGIEVTRQTLLRTVLPALHARAQALVLQCLGTVGTTSALAVWYLAAYAGSGIYEAGAVAGLGLVWALRRLQRRWGEDRSAFEGDVREQGRLVLGEIESLLRKTVREDKRPAVRAEDSLAWREARIAIDTAREELKKL
ncbi:hypothetical protein ANO11243_020090 [Dothideomycetidae sp. 11243]|nr:hypothetical protein ANO11243_020090 [fungal sp. No.11243]